MQGDSDLDDEDEEEGDAAASPEDNNFVVSDSEELYMYDDIKDAPATRAERLRPKVAGRKRKT